MNKTLKKMYSLYRSTLLQSHQKHGWKCISRLWYDSIPCGAHRDELPRRPSGGGRVAPVAGWAAWVSFGDASGGEGGLLKMVPFLPRLISHGWSLRDDLCLASSTRLQTTLKGHSTSSTFLYPVLTSLSFLPVLIPRWPLSTHSAGKGHHSVCNLNRDTIFY